MSVPERRAMVERLGETLSVDLPAMCAAESGAFGRLPLAWKSPQNVKRRTSRAIPIATLSAGINPLLSQSQRNGPYTQPAEVADIPRYPGGIILEWWARINRNAGDINPE